MSTITILKPCLFLYLLSAISQYKCSSKISRAFINYKNKGYSFMFDLNNKIGQFSNLNKFLCLNKCLENNYCISAIITSNNTCFLYYNMDLTSNMVDETGNNLYIKKYFDCGENRVFSGIKCSKINYS